MALAGEKVTWKHRVEYAGWQLVTGGLKLVPRRGMIAFADGAGWAMYYLLRLRRDVIDEQLAFALGEKYSENERRRIGCKSWQNCVLTFFEFVQPNPMGSAGWDDLREQEGFEEYCKPFLDTGKNAIIITAHIGNWEALGGLGTREGVELAAVAKPMHNPLVNDSILRSRARRGLEVLQIKRSMKIIIDAAKANKWVALVGDQDARRNGVFVDFFGRPASTAPGAAYFACKLNIPVLPSFCVRINDSGRHLKVIFMPPIYPNPDAPRDEEIKRITQEHTLALERVIRRYPSDYFWLHRRWKTQPKKTGTKTGTD